MSSSSALERFESSLSETVTSEKLSGSRVEKVRSLATRDFHLAGGLADVIVRVHRRASDKGKISSLYLLDAVARNAQDVVRKKASGFDYKEARPPNGSTARAGTKEAMVDGASAFLRACEQIVEEVVLTTSKAMRADQKDKVIKVVDIWLKAATFESGLLDGIRKRIVSGDDDFEAAQGPNNGGPSSSRRETQAKVASPPPPPNVPSNILAMLGGGGGAAPQTGSDSSRANTTAEAAAAPQSLDPNQLAMLKRVAAAQQQQQEPQQRMSQSIATSTHPAPPPPPPSKPEPAATNPSQSSAFRPDESVGDLSQFDLSAFDPTIANHWLRLAQQWHNTYQYVPSNQELMTGLISVMQSQMYMQSQMMQTGAGSGAGPYHGGQDGRQW